MICTKCGAANRHGAKFCDQCGQPLKPVAAQTLIPGPHPGMRYRRSAVRETLPPDVAQAATLQPKSGIKARCEPPSATLKREVRPPEYIASSPKQEASSVPQQPVVEPQHEAAMYPRPHAASAMRRRRQLLPEDDVMLSAEALHRRINQESSVEITTPEPRKRKQGGVSDDRDNITIMIVLVLVFFAILAVGAGGVYLNLRESHPDFLRDQAEHAKTSLNDHNPLRDVADSRVSGIASDSLEVLSVPDSIVPRSNPAVPEPAAANSPQVLVTEKIEAGSDPPRDSFAFRDSEVDEMLKNPDTSVGKPASKAYKAQFSQLFGTVVIERTYPTMAMKQRALSLWTREQKILEPDGRINDKYAPKRKPSLIPGH